MAFVIDPPPRYCAYLLRCWEARGQEEATWRFSVEDAHTGERRGFSGLDVLLAFLRAELALGCDPPAEEAAAVDPAGSIAGS